MSVHVEAIDRASASRLLPRRDPDGHKGTFGTVICVCGSLDYMGAALLSGTAAARAGAGLVGLAVPASLQSVVAGRVPELITVALPETDRGTDIDAMEAGHTLKPRSPDAFLFGSGIRESDGYAELLLGLFKRPGPPIVVDGGGLNILAARKGWSSDLQRSVVLTPHPGEFERLTGSPLGTADDERAGRAHEAARTFGVVVVLKGARTIVAGAGVVAASHVATALLATAGSGDVLAGTIASYLAQGLQPFDAAVVGVYLHARAGERMAETLGDAGMLASELPYQIALARRELSTAR